MNIRMYNLFFIFVHVYIYIRVLWLYYDCIGIKFIEYVHILYDDQQNKRHTEKIQYN